MPVAIDTEAFYRESCDSNFVKVSDIARNIAWTTPTEWGDLQITINLSKPEKDPRDIAAAAKAQASGKSDYIDPATGRARPCPLCVTEEDVECGYARHIELQGEPWGMWYSPYAYYNEHCIAMSWVHRPMHIDRAAFECLADFVDLIPGYFIGSNADLPIVGGSILSHDHFQGGRHTFPMEVAPVVQAFDMARHPEVEAGIVKWPLSVIRLRARDRAALVDAACEVLEAWRGYDDERVGIISHTGEVRHNTVTPIMRKRDGAYELDLALRCNITSDEHPLGVFHPHEELHHITKENIGLIEV
ncbi:MAG: galactose-1-phosphate uridylyltransferase, partial [Eggerthellaceae bacterium]|nr:galactose-1-phosphate uridylyltransferase [Eggerthellaceae bacterium]